jgi:chromate transporter
MTAASDSHSTAPPCVPSFGEALKWWFRLGCISFGGPAGQIAIMHRELVERRRWISDGHFLHALNFCMLLPGPEAQQLATYLGWRLHGARGGIAAGALFVLPSALLLVVLSWLFMAGHRLPWIAAAFHGIAPVVVAIIAAAALRIGRKALRTRALWVIAALSFAAIRFAPIPFPLILAAAAAVGWATSRFQPPAAPHHEAAAPEDDFVRLPPPAAPGLRRSLTIISACLLLWLIPLAFSAITLGLPHAITVMGLFFSRTALLTFGGAYAILPYVAQQAVDHHQWLTAQEMMAGLALAETTPGPLIMVLQFVGFAGGWHHGQPLCPLAGGAAAAALTTWCTFLPSFLMVFLGAPHIESFHGKPALAAALAAITACVTGVIFNLALHLAAATLLTPAGSLNLPATGLAILAFVLLTKTRTPIPAIVAAAAALGAARSFFFS